MGSITSFTKFVAWQKAREVRKAVRSLVRNWPSEEKFRLTDQIIRSSRGPCSNIAEGFGRFREKDNMRFCRIAKGSIHETQDHLTAAYDEEYISADQLKEYWALTEEAVRVINGYINYLETISGSNRVSEPVEEYGTTSPIFADISNDLPLTTDN